MLYFPNTCARGSLPAFSSWDACERILEGGGIVLKLLKSLALTTMCILLLGIVGLQSVAAESPQTGAASDDVAAKVICNVVVFVQRLGLPIMTGVILGASIMAIFGKMAWASIVVLVVFTAIFFGAGKLMQKFAAGVGFSDGSNGGKADTFQCLGGGRTTLPK